MANRLSSDAILLDGISKTVTKWIRQGYVGPVGLIIVDDSTGTDLPVDLSNYRFSDIQVDLFSGLVDNDGVTANLKPLEAPLGELHLVPSSEIGRFDLMIPEGFYTGNIPPNANTTPIVLATFQIDLPSGIKQPLVVQIIISYGKRS